MFASLFIIVVSSALFLYWFRYTCLLLIRQGSAEYALKVASTIRLSFTQVQDALQTESQSAALIRLHESLESDYEILTDLLGQAACGDSIQRRILTIDYKVMQMWYKVVVNSNPLQAKIALAEMSSILGYFASEIGETAGA